MEKNPAKRLGVNGAEEVKAHPWFQSVEWKLMLEKKVKPPLIPFSESEADTRNFDKVAQQQQIILFFKIGIN